MTSVSNELRWTVGYWTSICRKDPCSIVTMYIYIVTTVVQLLVRVLTKNHADTVSDKSVFLYVLGSRGNSRCRRILVIKPKNL